MIRDGNQGVTQDIFEKIENFIDAVKKLASEPEISEESLEAIKQYPYASIAYAKELVGSNLDIVRAAIQKSTLATQYMDSKLFDNPGVVNEIYNSLGYYYDYPEDILEDSGREDDFIDIGGITVANLGEGYEFLSNEPITFDGKTKIAIFHDGQGQLIPTIGTNEQIPTRVMNVEVWDSESRNYYFNEQIYNTENFYKEVRDKLDKEDGFYKLEVVGIPANLYNKLGGTIQDENDGPVNVHYSMPTLVYNTSLSPEINEKLLMAYFEAVQYYEENPVLDTSFIEYHLGDLLDCFGGKEGLISFVTEHGKNDPNFVDFDKYIEQLSKDIDKTEEYKKEHPNPYKISEIGEKASNTKQGTLNEVMEETTREGTIQKLNPNTIDEGSNPGGDNR